MHSSCINKLYLNPCQPEDRKLCESAIEELRCNLLQLNQYCAFLYILISSVDIIALHHTHALSQADDMHLDNRATPETKDSS